eukprot:CAMPEP_0172482806 /NCGR_PEP_ID=MMETSP1066-20121228/9428_1 /TAXON_ID=671091 /ORGANISM="Coscinodiscus wailesii, Strain CCMP2513" /LENGTH=115 /DNA_ID=CAMNT_0013246229 /DNA_START=314 /DNA_END=661 /DNA_ORIENTATION=-
MTSLYYRYIADGTVLSAIETQYSAYAGGKIVVDVLLHTPCNGDECKQRKLFSLAIDIINVLMEDGGKTPGEGLLRRSETSYFEVPSGNDEVVRLSQSLLGFGPTQGGEGRAVIVL